MINPAMPDWMAALFAPFLPQKSTAPPFVPAFDTVELISAHAMPGSGQILNTAYYVTRETAVALMGKFHAQRIEEHPEEVTSDGGVVTIAGDPGDVGKPAVQRFLIFPVGSMLKDAYGNTVGATPVEIRMEAGLLANCYVRLPEADLPAQTLTIGWPPQSILALSAAERDAWAMLRAAAGFAT